MNEQAIISRRKGHAKIVLAVPRECGCKRMVCFCVNRDGKTRCLECDRKYVDSLLERTPGGSLASEEWMTADGGYQDGRKGQLKECIKALTILIGDAPAAQKGLGERDE